MDAKIVAAFDRKPGECAEVLKKMWKDNPKQVEKFMRDQPGFADIFPQKIQMPGSRGCKISGLVSKFGKEKPSKFEKMMGKWNAADTKEDFDSPMKVKNPNKKKFGAKKGAPQKIDIYADEDKGQAAKPVFPAGYTPPSTRSKIVIPKEDEEEKKPAFQVQLKKVQTLEKNLEEKVEVQQFLKKMETIEIEMAKEEEAPKHDAVLGEIGKKVKPVDDAATSPKSDGKGVPEQSEDVPASVAERTPLKESKEGHEAVKAVQENKEIKRMATLKDVTEGEEGDLLKDAEKKEVLLAELDKKVEPAEPVEEEATTEEGREESGEDDVEAVEEAAERNHLKPSEEAHKKLDEIETNVAVVELVKEDVAKGEDIVKVVEQPKESQSEESAPDAPPMKKEGTLSRIISKVSSKFSRTKSNISAEPEAKSPDAKAPVVEEEPKPVEKPAEVAKVGGTGDTTPDAALGEKKKRRERKPRSKAASKWTSKATE